MAGGASLLVVFLIGTIGFSAWLTATAKHEYVTDTVYCTDRRKEQTIICNIDSTIISLYSISVLQRARNSPTGKESKKKENYHKKTQKEGIFFQSICPPF